MPNPKESPWAARARGAAPLAAAALALGVFFAFGGADYVSLDGLREHRADLTALVAEQPVLTAAALFLVYVTLVAMAFPSTIVLTLAGGYLFGMAGWALSTLAATVGAILLFFAARTAFGEGLRLRFRGVLARLEQGFQGNAFLYLLSLRLFPFAPFVAVTLAGAFFGARWRTFGLATLIGTAPATFIYTGVGAGAGAILDQGGELSVQSALFQPLVLGSLLGIAALAAAPALWRTWRQRLEETPQ
jgi:uncharacterized membrane protein YdjX (TVP38/TMEM64 family)